MTVNGYLLINLKDEYDDLQVSNERRAGVVSHNMSKQILYKIGKIDYQVLPWIFLDIITVIKGSASQTKENVITNTIMSKIVQSKIRNKALIFVIIKNEHNVQKQVVEVEQ